jgi:hypothetical protein
MVWTVREVNRTVRVPLVLWVETGETLGSMSGDIRRTLHSE